MQKSKKKLLGLLGLAFVAAMTVFAYFLPANGAYAEGEPSDSHTDVIRVTVYDRYPSIKIDSPATDYITTSPEFELAFTYENSTYVDFVLRYEELDEEGNVSAVHEVAVPRFNPDPSRLDPTFNFDSDSNTVAINLNDPNGDGDESDALGYGHYILTATSASPIGPSTGDAIEFDFVPVQLIQTGSAANTNNPIATVEYDDGVAMIELVPVDSHGNPLFEEPIVVYVEPDENGDFLAGSQSVTFPFTEAGFATGDYDILVTAYSGTVTPGEIDPDTGEQGEDIIDYAVIPSPRVLYPVNYVQPPAPDVPDTGRLTNGALNIAKSDYVITAVIAFVGIAIAAFLILGRKKKDYRRNIRSRK